MEVATTIADNTSAYQIKPIIMPAFVGIMGGPVSGKTTLLRTIKKSCTCVGGSVVCADYSRHIHAWHINPDNHSPLRNMCLAHEEYRKKGQLIPDEEVNQALMYYLYAQERKIIFEESMVERPSGPTRKLGIGTFICSGWPRTPNQRELMEKAFVDAQLAMIDLTKDRANQLRELRISKANGEVRDDDDPDIFMGRWKTFEESTLPEFHAFKEKFPTKVIHVSFDHKLAKRAKKVIIRGIGDPLVRRSMLTKIEPSTPGVETTATRFIRSIEEQSKKTP